jgi:hypothetical protein
MKGIIAEFGSEKISKPVPNMQKLGKEIIVHCTEFH